MECALNYAVPARIFLTLKPLLCKDEQLLHLIKTTWKPKAGRPTLWLALTDQRLLVFSSLRGREVFAQARALEIDSIRIQSGSVVEILMKDEQRGDLRIPIEPESKHLLPDFVRTLSSQLEK